VVLTLVRDPESKFVTKKQGERNKMHYFKWVVLTSLLAAAPACAESTNQWYLRGPEGGYAYRVGIDPVSNRVLAGGAAGIFRFNSAGGVWEYANAGAPTSFVGDIVKTATASFINSGGVVARSTDGGATWIVVSDPAMGAAVYSMATSPNAPNRVYVAVDTGGNDNANGLWVSDNLGATWTQRAISAGGKLRLVRASPTDANIVYVGNEVDQNGIAQLYRSSDGGITFVDPNPVLQSGGNSNVGLEFIDVAQDPFDANRVVALTAPPPEAFTDKSQGGQVFVSHDGGVTFDAGSNNNFVLAPETVGGAEPRAVVFDRNTVNVVYFATTWGLFKSVNSPPALVSSGMMQLGTRPSGAHPFDEVDSLTQQADGTLFAGTSSGGVYRSNNGAASWTSLTTGYTGLNYRMFAFQPNNTGVVLAGSADPSNISAVFRSIDGGATWSRSTSGLNAASVRGLAFSPANASLVIAAGFSQANVGGESTRGVWRSTDAGATWSSVTDGGIGFQNKRIVVFDPNDGNRVLVTSALRVNLSINAGVNWVNSVGSPASFGGLPFSNNPDLSILGLAAGPKSGGGTRFYIGVSNNAPPGSPLPVPCQSDSLLPCKGGVYYSDDGGFHWTRGTGITDDSAWYVSAGATPGTVFAGQGLGPGYSGGVFKSTDYGATWTDSSAGLTCRNILSQIAADPTDNSVAWTACTFTDVAHPGGIFRSNDAGASWVPYGRGLRNPSVTWLTIDPADHDHLLATSLEGVQEMHFAADSDQDGIPDSEEAAVAPNGDANGDNIPDATQANVASTGVAAPLLPIKVSATAANDYVVVEVQNAAAVDNGKCQFVSDLVVAPTNEIPPFKGMLPGAPIVHFILPNCEQATVKIRYSGVTSYPLGVFGSYSPTLAGDASTIKWGLLPANAASVDGNGLWTLHLDQNSYGNVYANDSGSILFQGVPGTDRVFGSGFESN